MEEYARDADGLKEDMAINHSLDIVIASKFMDFKLAEGEADAMGNQVPA
jgi:hypothetical protein